MFTNENSATATDERNKMTKNELKLKRLLLDKDFEGYKLSLASLPVHKTDLEDSVAFALPNDDQYNYLFQLEYATQNHLIEDPWSQDSVYFIDDAGCILGNCPNDRGALDSCKEVYSVYSATQSHCTSTPRVGRFAATMRFASDQTVVLSDGLGSIHLADTGSRSEFTPWKLLHSDTPLDEDSTFKVLDARYTEDSKTFQVLISYVSPMSSDKTENEKQPPVGTVVIWLTYTLNGESQWTKTSEKINCKGEIDYVAVEPTGQAVYLASAFAPISTVEEDTVGSKSMELQPEMKKTEIPTSYDYHWQQTYDEIKLWLRVPLGTSPTEIRVDTKLTSIVVVYNQKPILIGKTYHCIEPELTTWSIQDDRLEIIVQKSEEGAMWQTFIDSNKKGKEIPDDEVVADIHSRLEHLCSETEEKGDPVVLNGNSPEECDASDKDRSMYRFLRGAITPSHKVPLGNNQWLFNIHLSPDSVPAFCMRNDVDGCVWQPTPPVEDSTDWSIEHEGTILAFGYVQASKTNRKFSVASKKGYKCSGCHPRARIFWGLERLGEVDRAGENEGISKTSDLSYVAIIEITGHVILFRKGVAVTSSLRNRISGRSVQKIGMQNLINLRTSDAILGAAAFNDKFYVLSKNALFLVQVV